MGKVTIYTTALCGYCRRAKLLLDQKGVDYEEIDVSFDPDERAKMREMANGAFTVPQIFICGKHVGGSDDLFALDYEGKLDALLEECRARQMSGQMEAPDAG